MEILSRTKGMLVYISNGVECVIIHCDIWANLQREKKLMIMRGYDASNIKLKYIKK